MIMGTINLKTSLRSLGFLKENKEKYITSIVRYSTISSEELIEMASENSGIPKAQMAASFYALNQQMEQFVLNGHTLTVGTLGTIYLSSKAKASDTKEGAGADSVVRISVKFRQSKKVRDMLNSKVSLVMSTKPKSTSEEGGNSNPGGNTGSDGDENENPLG